MHSNMYFCNKARHFLLISPFIIIYMLWLNFSKTALICKWYNIQITNLDLIWSCLSISFSTYKHYKKQWNELNAWFSISSFIHHKYYRLFFYSRIFFAKKQNPPEPYVCLSVCMFDLFLAIFFCLLPWDSLWTHRNNNLSQESFVCNTSEMGRRWFSLGHEKPVSYTRNKSIFCWGSVHPVRIYQH